MRGSSQQLDAKAFFNGSRQTEQAPILAFSDVVHVLLDGVHQAFPCFHTRPEACEA